MSIVQTSISLVDVVPFINWTYFFHAWQVSGNYVGLTSLCQCEACRQQWLSRYTLHERQKAEEALNLYMDAQAQLRHWQEHDTLTIQAKYGFFDAYSKDQLILLSHLSAQLTIPTLRQQRPRQDGSCWSLADFVASENDQVGLFAVAVHGASSSTDDTYHSLLQRTLADRLAEATAEYLHRTLLQQNSIRPAFGYPSLPDVSLLFDVERFFKISEIGIRLTHHAAMQPSSSICGMYVQHPHVRYFRVGDISRQQLSWYATQRGMTIEQISPFLNLNII